MDLIIVFGKVLLLVGVSSVAIWFTFRALDEWKNEGVFLQFSILLAFVWVWSKIIASAVELIANAGTS